MGIEIQHKPNTRQMYETTFIVVPEISDADAGKVSKKFEDMIKEHGGELINVEHWGQRKLAYPIKRRNSGYFTYIEFTAEPDLISKVEQEYIYDDNIIRYLTVKLEKFAQEYNEKRRSGEFAKKEEKTDK